MLDNLPDYADLINFSIFAFDGHGAIIFCWINDSNGACSQFVNSIKTLEEADIGNAIVRFAFEFCDNTYFSPKWWDSCGIRLKEKIQVRANNFGSFKDPHLDNCLINDGFEYVDWKIISIVSDSQ